MKNMVWRSGSIRMRATLTQIALLLVPLTICTVLLVRQVASENALRSAAVTYQYDRYIVDSLDTACRQMESMANTIAGNKSVREYVAMETPVERTELFETQVANLLRYAYNRYLPTKNIQVIPDMTLEELMRDTHAAYYNRSRYRLWEFIPGDDLPECVFYYQFEGDGGVPGVIEFRPTANMLLDAVSSLSSINRQDCALLGTDGKPLFLPASLTDEQRAVLSDSTRHISEGYEMLSNRQMFYGISCEVLPVQFVSFQPAVPSWHLTRETLPTILVCVVLIILSVYVSYRVFIRSITDRIISLSDSVRSLPLDRLEQTGGDPLSLVPETKKPVEIPMVQVTGQDEIAQLAESINDMIRRIAELSRLNEQEVRTSQRTAYDMLAAQIHPHFIYNTLENLRMMAEINDDLQVADQLYALGRMLRLSISDASSIGEVRMEVEHAQMYLQLQQLRLNYRLDYRIEPIDEEILQEKCPRFLLQPLVENALKHGFHEKKTPCSIVIRAGRDEKGIWLSVFNDGENFTPERLEEVREALRHNHPVKNTRGGIGLLNINTRLRMFYGEEAGLTIVSDREHGTTCTLRLVTKK